MRRGTNLPSRFSDKREAEAGVVALDLKCSKTAEHVAREQVLFRQACPVNRQPVVGSRGPDIEHVGMQPCSESGCLAYGRSNVRSEWRLTAPGECVKRERHSLTEVTASRRIVTSLTAEPKQVNRYLKLAGYLTDLVDG